MVLPEETMLSFVFYALIAYAIFLAGRGLWSLVLLISAGNFGVQEQGYHTLSRKGETAWEKRGLKAH
jgi:hypothetical protein